MDEKITTFDDLNKLCWAIGSINANMPQDEERNFLVTVIKVYIYIYIYIGTADPMRT